MTFPIIKNGLFRVISITVLLAFTFIPARSMKDPLYVCGSSLYSGNSNKSNVCDIKFAGDDNSLALIAGYYSKIVVSDLDDNKLVDIVHKPFEDESYDWYMGNIIVLDDKKTIINSQLDVFDLYEGFLYNIDTIDSETNSKFDISPDGKYLCVSYADKGSFNQLHNRLAIYNIETKEKIFELLEYDNIINYSFIGNGQIIICDNWSNYPEIIFYDFINNKRLKSIETQYPGQVLKCISKDRRYILMFRFDDYCVYDLKNDEVVLTIDHSLGSNLQFSENTDYLIYTLDSNINIIDYRKDQVIDIIKTPFNKIGKLRVRDDFSMLMSDNTKVLFYDYSIKTFSDPIKFYKEFSNIEIDSDGNAILSNLFNEIVSFNPLTKEINWRKNTFTEYNLSTYTEHNQYNILNIKNNIIFQSALDEELQNYFMLMINPENGNLLHKIGPFKDTISDISVYNNEIIIGFLNGRIIRYNPNDNSHSDICTFKGQFYKFSENIKNSKILTVLFEPDSEDKKTKIYELALPNGEYNLVNDIAFRPSPVYNNNVFSENDKYFGNIYLETTMICNIPEGIDELILFQDEARSIFINEERNSVFLGANGKIIEVDATTGNWTGGNIIDEYGNYPFTSDRHWSQPYFLDVVCYENMLYGVSSDGCFVAYELSPVSVEAKSATTANKLIVYPNPAPGNGRLTIELPDMPENNSVIKIFDINGENVKTISTNTGTINLSADELLPGAYYVRYYSNTGIYNSRLIVY